MPSDNHCCTYYPGNLACSQVSGVQPSKVVCLFVLLFFQMNYSKIFIEKIIMIIGTASDLVVSIIETHSGKLRVRLAIVIFACFPNKLLLCLCLSVYL